MGKNNAIQLERKNGEEGEKVKFKVQTQEKCGRRNIKNNKIYINSSHQVKPNKTKSFLVIYMPKKIVKEAIISNNTKCIFYFLNTYHLRKDRAF